MTKDPMVVVTSVLPVDPVDRYATRDTADQYVLSDPRLRRAKGKLAHNWLVTA
jgi:hypothetical protein